MSQPTAPAAPAPAAAATPSPAAPAPAAAPSSAAAPSAPAAKAPAVTTPQGANKVTQDAPPPGETPAQAAERKARKYQIKIDGKVSDIDLDAVDDQEIVKRWQMAEAAQRRMQEAAETRKQAAELFERLKKDPIAALQDPSIGVDVRKMVEEQILREYEEAQLSEPERRAKQLERELQARETKIKEYEEAQQRAAQEQLNERVFQETQAQFTKALETAGLPNSRETIYMMADIAQANLENGIDLGPAQLAAAVKERMQGMHQHFIGSLKGEQLMSYLGDSVITEVLKFAVEQVKAQQNQTAFQPPEQSRPQEPEMDDEGRIKRKLVTSPIERKKFFRGG